MDRPLLPLLLTLPLLAVACSEPPAPIDEPAPEPTPIPSTLPIVATTTLCAALLDGERLLSVSPEGHAWLGRDGGEGLLVRVLDTFPGEAVLSTHELELPGVVSLHAWSATDAVVLTEAGLFELEDLARIALSTPEGFTGAASSCGLPSENGFLVSGGRISELRQDGQWWSWSPVLPGDDEAAALAAVGGECQDRTNRQWMMTDGGALFDVSTDVATFVAEFGAWQSSAATDEHVFVLEPGLLHVAPAPVASWALGADVADGALRSDGSRVYMVLGGRVVRFDGAAWEEVAAGGATVEEVAPHAAGVVTVGGGEVCDHRFGESLRVHGARPYMRTSHDAVSVALELPPGASAPVLTLDGEELTTTLGDDGRFEAEVELEEVGWHELVATSGAAERSLWVKRMPATLRSWEADIAPLYAATCASSQCHGTKAVDMSTVDAWREHADAIRARVVDAKTMPPPANKPADWDDDEIAVIAEWLEGGMLQ